MTCRNQLLPGVVAEGVRCPHCALPVGVPCRLVRGWDGTTEPHAERIKLVNNRHSHRPSDTKAAA